MKATGIVRKVDELGRIVIPIELRRNIGIDIKDSLEIFTDDDSIVLKKYEPGCMECGKIDESLISGKKVRLCKECSKKLSAS